MYPLADKVIKAVLLGVMMTAVSALAGQWYILSWAGDATLTEVQFADSLRGWTTARHNLFHTTDRGRTWRVERNITDTSFGGLAVIDSGHLFVSLGIVYVPHYVHWYVWIDERVNGHWISRYYNHADNVDYALQACRLAAFDGMHLWHLGDDHSPYVGVAVRTTDGGNTWARFTSGYYDASFIDSLTGWACADKIGKTTTAGDSWQVLTSNIGARRIQMFDSLNGWVMTTSGLMSTTNGGDSWTTAVSQVGLQAMRFCDPRNGIAVGLGGTILRTTDAGVTWLRDTAEYSADLYSVCMLDSTHAWAGGGFGLVLGMGDWAVPGVEERRQFPSRFQLARAWPNPCRGTLWLGCRGGAGSIVVYDDCGRPVRGVRCTSARAEKLDLRDLPVGVYFVRVTSSPRTGFRFVLLR
jgi:photosystem II stability/assembly factor-like uncharacterized protein